MQERTMSVLGRAAAACPAGAETTSRIWRRLEWALSWRDGAQDNPYSPVVCISLLVIVGIIIKIGPVIHEVLAQHW
jgi:hypothetical protein